LVPLLLMLALRFLRRYILRPRLSRSPNLYKKGLVIIKKVF